MREATSLKTTTMSAIARGITSNNSNAIAKGGKINRLVNLSYVLTKQTPWLTKILTSTLIVFSRGTPVGEVASPILRGTSMILQHHKNTLSTLSTKSCMAVYRVVMKISELKLWSVN